MRWKLILFQNLQIRLFTHGKYQKRIKLNETKITKFYDIKFVDIIIFWIMRSHLNVTKVETKQKKERLISINLVKLNESIRINISILAR
jgi:hypothetical protein